MNGMKGPHIFDTAAAELEEEVFEGAGLLEVDASDHNGSPGPVFGMALSGRNKDGLLVRVGTLPTGEPYLSFRAMKIDTGDPVEICVTCDGDTAFVTTKTD